MEGANVTMECEARGLPTPNITWRRDDDKKLSLARPAVSAGGKRIELYNVQRMDAGSYNCIASNRVPPPRSRSIMLRVQYSPSIMPSPSPLQGVVLDRNVTMKCHTEAYPAVTDGQWFKDNIAIGDITDRYLPIIRPRSGSTAVTLELFIINVRKEDTGEYSCKASNIVGSVEARIDIDEVLPPPPTTTTELPSTAPKAGGTKGREHRKDRNKDRKGDNEDVDSEDMVQNTDLFSSISQDGRTAKDDASANDQTKTPIHVNESKDKATVGNKASFAHRCSVVLRLFCCAVIVFLSSLWDELT
ncbi:PREDICTED: lachesin-like [Priapulus caudatus]|uniref:Lachesin-like n=1 Tax=Priapulus caudatus TaxID=37621 RepID=A0ABM1EF83_PRICU|nr:PREDICTED: lachesin-like [Priapulus caudatus]